MQESWPSPGSRPPAATPARIEPYVYRSSDRGRSGALLRCHRRGRHVSRDRRLPSAPRDGSGVGPEGYFGIRFVSAGLPPFYRSAAASLCDRRLLALGELQRLGCGFCINSPSAMVGALDRWTLCAPPYRFDLARKTDYTAHTASGNLYRYVAHGGDAVHAGAARRRVTNRSKPASRGSASAHSLA